MVILLLCFICWFFFLGMSGSCFGGEIVLSALELALEGEVPQTSQEEEE